MVPSIAMSITIQFNISHLFGSGSNGNEGVLHILKISSDSIMSYTGHLLGGYYLFVEMQLMYSTGPTDWPVFVDNRTALPIALICLLISNNVSDQMTLGWFPVKEQTTTHFWISFAHFKVKIVDRDKSWASHKVCKLCVEILKLLTKGHVMRTCLVYL